MDIKREILKFYGNRGLKFDFLISFILVLSTYFTLQQYGLSLTMERDLLFSMVEFFGVLLGFLLTAFSILYFYNPSEKFSEFRKHSMFTGMLKAFLYTIIFCLITIAITYTKLQLQTGIVALDYLIFLFSILTFLRILKCIYYLFAIINIGNLDTKTGTK